MARVPQTASRKMHQTTLRFGTDLWGALEEEAGRLGVSAAQYVRDATLARLSYDAGRRDELEGGRRPRGSEAPTSSEDAVTVAQERAREEVSHSEALWAQGRLARRRAAELRGAVIKTRAAIGNQKT